MFNFSFSKISPQKSEELEEKFPLVVSLDFGKMKEPSEGQNTLKPMVCENCGSVLSNSEDLVNEADGYAFTCEFCAHKNKLTEQEALDLKKGIEESREILNGSPSEGQMSSQSSSQQLSFLLDDIREKDENLKNLEIEGAGGGFPIQIATIDVSGSMSGGKIEAVKHALVQNVHEITAEFPKTRFSLVPFSSNVEIYSSPSEKFVVKDGPIFFSPDQMQDQARNIVESSSLLEIRNSYEDWAQEIKRLHSLNMTALGPALFLSVHTIIASQSSKQEKEGGKVLLLTDGLANVGLGSVEGMSSEGENKHKVFYQKVSETCLENNIVVDVVGVRDRDGSNSVALDIIGKITDYTGGSMKFITVEQVESAFSSLTRTQYVARGVTLRVYAPEFLKLVEIEGTNVLGAIPEKNGEPIKLGAFSNDRELYLKFKQKAPYGLKTGSKIPIQLQLEYKDSNNLRRVKAFHKWVEVAPDEEDFKKRYDPKIATAFELSKASKMKARGDYSQAKQQAKLSMSRNFAYSSSYNQDLSQMNALIEDEMDEWEKEEEFASQIADKKSYSASMGQMRYRANISKKLKRMKSKKKKKDE